MFSRENTAVAMLNSNGPSSSSDNPNSLYASYRSRLQTFVELNRRYNMTEDFRALARSGYYFRALQHNMCCYFCGVILSSTRSCHRRHTPQCAGRVLFNSAQKRRLDNFPVVNFSDLRLPRASDLGSSSRGTDVNLSDTESGGENEDEFPQPSMGGSYVMRNVSPNSELGQFILRNVETVMNSFRTNHSYAMHGSGLNGFTVDIPVAQSEPVTEIINGSDFAPVPLCPGFTRYDERLKSFHDWPLSMGVDKHVLCSAGFFYTGKSDQVACYYCGYKRNGWIPTDDPWRLHALHVPPAVCFSTSRPRISCHFVVMSRGQQYVDDVRADFLAEGNDLESSTSINDSSTTSQNVSPQTSTSPPSFSSVNTCVVCCEETSDVVFEPCSHMISCYKCAVGQPTCFVCRQKIVRLRKVYFG